MSVRRPRGSRKRAPTAKAGGRRGRRRFLPDSFPVVGIGASAGGLEAFTKLLKHLPGDTGMAFVLVQHLDPSHASALTEILSRATAMPVTEVRDGMRVEPNHVYVIPPNTNMAILHRVLSLMPRTEKHGLHLPIDYSSARWPRIEGAGQSV
jgi:two-component system CheB/CheR fusion protein